MSCSLILAAALAFSDPAVVEPAPVVVAEAPASVASEPLFADLVLRSVSLKAIVDGWIASGEADQSGFFAGPAYGRFKAQATDLAARDMAGHEDLKARDLDGDLKCILRGIAEDMPRRLAALEAATEAAERRQALEELAYLLNDNAEVITAPPRRAV
ncbi:hypothetical protein [Brevundimonas vesicularis]|uniref:hypothetical protein n=1 Tax=Brevundimonas vesicularis TaxID=41276 RepID=UPI0038D40C67